MRDEQWLLFTVGQRPYTTLSSAFFERTSQSTPPPSQQQSRGNAARRDVSRSLQQPQPQHAAAAAAAAATVASCAAASGGGDGCGFALLTAAAEHSSRLSGDSLNNGPLAALRYEPTTVDEDLVCAYVCRSVAGPRSISPMRLAALLSCRFRIADSARNVNGRTRERAKIQRTTLRMT